MSNQKTVKHTPGPWMVSTTASIAVYPEKAGSSHICELNRSRSSSHANAELIARAPELLERVQELETENAKLVIRAGFDNKNAMEAAVDATKSNLSQRALIRKLRVVVEAAREATYTCSPATKEKIETALEVLEAHNEPKKDRG